MFSMFVASDDHFNRVVEALAAVLRRLGYSSFDLARCADLLAHMYGFPDAATAAAAREHNSPSPTDDKVGKMRVRRRQAQAVETLTADGIAPADAIAIVEEIAPTGSPQQTSAPWLVPLPPSASASLNSAIPRLLRRFALVRSLLGTWRDGTCVEAASRSRFLHSLLEKDDVVPQDLFDHFAELHRLGRDLRDLQVHLIRDIGQELARAVAAERVPSSVRARIISVFRNDTISPDPTDFTSLVHLADLVGESAIGESIVDLAERTPEAARRLAWTIVNDLRFLQARRVGPAHFAIAIAYACSGILTLPGDGSELSGIRERIDVQPCAIAALDFDIADRTLLAAADKMQQLGLNSQVMAMHSDDVFGHYGGLDRTVILRADGSRALAGDILACAQHAGLTVADLADAVRRAVSLLADALEADASIEPDGLDYAFIRHSVTRDGGGDRGDPDLVRVALASGLATLCPRHGYSPGVSAALMAMHVEGATLADLVVQEWVRLVPAEVVSDLAAMTPPTTSRH